MDIPVKYQNKPINSTKRASQELWQLGLDLDDILVILEKGYDCSASKRKKEVIEKCIAKGKKIIKIVLIDCESYWLLIHVGEFSRR